MPNPREQAEALIDAYARKTDWTVARQVVLRCLSVTWAESSTVARFYRLAEPLTGQALPHADVAAELGRMRKAGLVRSRMVAGERHYELNLPV